MSVHNRASAETGTVTPPAHAAAPAPRRASRRGGAWPSDREALHPEAVHASASSRRRADGPSHAPPPSRRRRWARRCASAAAPAARGQEGGEGWPTSADVGRRHVGPSGAGTELSTSTRLVHALPPRRRWRWAIGARRAGVCFCLRLVPSHAARVASARLWPRSPSTTPDLGTARAAPACRCQARPAGRPIGADTGSRDRLTHSRGGYAGRGRGSGPLSRRRRAGRRKGSWACRKSDSCASRKEDLQTTRRLQLAGAEDRPLHFWSTAPTVV